MIYDDVILSMIRTYVFDLINDPRAACHVLVCLPVRYNDGGLLVSMRFYAQMSFE